MIWSIKESKQAIKFLEKNSIDKLQSYIIKSIKKVIYKERINIDIKKMKGEWKGYYRIRQGEIRIVITFDIINKTVYIHKIGWRGNIYS